MHLNIDGYQYKYETFPRVLAEFIGTFVLIFAGTGAVMVDKIASGAVTHLGISIVFGAIVTALIYSLGHISGAHFNSAVTLAFWSSGFLRCSLVVPYMVAQILGAIAASVLLRLSLGAMGNLGATLPRDGNWLQALILKTLLTKKPPELLPRICRRWHDEGFSLSRFSRGETTPTSRLYHGRTLQIYPIITG